MQTYYQIVEVEAEEMNFSDALERGYTVDFQNPNKSGYHIVYKDGSHSWLHKDVFESIYKVKVKK